MSKFKSFRESYKEFVYFNTEIAYLIALILMLLIATIIALSVVIHEQNQKINFLQYTLDSTPYYSVTERPINRILRNERNMKYNSHR